MTHDCEKKNIKTGVNQHLKKLELPTTPETENYVFELNFWKVFAKWNKWLPYIIHFLMSISHQAKQNYYGQEKFQSAEGFKPLLVFTLEKITRNIFRYSLIHKYVYQLVLHIFLLLHFSWYFGNSFTYCTKLNRYFTTFLCI